MEIIRDEELFGLAMIPLFADWGIRRCNVEGCMNKPTTIITGIAEVGGPFGLCEEHHNEAKTKGELDFTLEFDDFDAFNAPDAGPIPAAREGHSESEGRARDGQRDN